MKIDLPDDVVMQLMGAVMKKAGLKDGNPMLGLEGLQIGDDPENKIKGWSALKIETGEDDRPELADKDYVIKKLALDPGMHDVGHDDGGGDYAKPF